MRLVQLDHLSDLDFIKHLYTKDNPSQEELDAAVRMEHMLESYSSLLESIHRLAQKGLDEGESSTLASIATMTAPAEQEASAMQ
jgi:hypothetical protein